MRKNRKEKAAGLTRRQALTCAAATFGFGLATGKSLSAEERRAATLPGAKVCILTPEAVEGPFYFDPKLVRADITERRRGAPLALTLQVASVKDCARLKGASISGTPTVRACIPVIAAKAAAESRPVERASCAARNSLMPTVRFATIYPGWYPGRTPHIHFKVLLDAASLVTGQLYFPDDLSARIYAGVAPYNERKTKRDIVANEEDFIFLDQSGAETLVSVTEEGGTCRASLVIGVDRGG